MDGITKIKTEKPSTPLHISLKSLELLRYFH